MNKLERKPDFQSPTTHACRCWKNTCDLTHVVEGFDSTNKQNAPTRVHMYTTRVCIYMYMHTYTQTHIHAYTYMCTCTYTRIHAHTYTHTCTRTSIHRQKISATTPQLVKQYHRGTYASIYICMYIHIYMPIHICAQPAANVSQMCMLMSRRVLWFLARLMSIQSRTNRFLHSVPVAVTICVTRYEVSGQQTPSAEKLFYHANFM